MDKGTNDFAQLSGADPTFHHKMGEAQINPNHGSFGWALDLMLQGLKLFRQEWNGKGMYLQIQRPHAKSKMSRPYIYIKTAQNDLVPWTASHGDLLGRDWLVVRD